MIYLFMRQPICYAFVIDYLLFVVVLLAAVVAVVVVVAVVEAVVALYLNVTSFHRS